VGEGVSDLREMVAVVVALVIKETEKKKTTLK
jgi:hypothetical protein